MSEETPGIGAGLRRAREAKGLTVKDVGSRMRLMSRQVEAIEAEEFSKLGPPVFARGFVRNYAKLLGLDPDELLDQMTRVKTTTVQEPESVPFKPDQSFWKSPLVLAGIAATFLLIAIPVGLYLWLSSGEEETPPAVEQTVPPPPPPPAPQLEVQSAAPTTESTTTVPTATLPAPMQHPQAKPVQPPPATAPAVPQVKPVPPAGSTPAAPVMQPTATAQPAAPAPANFSSLRMQFDEAAWVQVRDSSGRMVHSGLNPAGTSVEVNGKAPFYLVVGNAAHVRLNYKGKEIDLKPFTAVNVARLTLEQ